MDDNFNYDNLMFKASTLYDQKDFVQLEAFLSEIYDRLNRMSPDDFNDIQQHTDRYKMLELYFQVSSLLKNIDDIQEEEEVVVPEPSLVHKLKKPFKGYSKIEKDLKLKEDEQKEKDHQKASKKNYTETWQLYREREPFQIKKEDFRSSKIEKDLKLKEEQVSEDEATVKRHKKLLEDVKKLKEKEKGLKKGSWLSHIVAAIIELGGEAHLSQIYYKVKAFRRKNGFTLSDSFESVIRKEIYIRTPGLKSYRNKDYYDGKGFAMNAKPTFYIVNKVGDGRIGLLSMKK